MKKEEWQHQGAGHRQRLRDKFLELGIEAFNDAEIIELLLTMGTPRKNCKEPARALLKKFGSLAAVLDASQQELEQIKDIGPKNSFAFHFIHSVARRYLEQRLVAKDYLQSSKQVADFLVHSMRDLKKEVFFVIFLDASHAIIKSEILSEGTLTSNVVYPRELIKAALDNHAAAVIIAHNHPSGNQLPSEQDRKLTRNLYLALSFVNIKLLDHFIVAGSETPYSFADHQIMAEIFKECSHLLQYE